MARPSSTLAHDATQFGNTPFCSRTTIGHLPYNVRLQVKPAPVNSRTKNGFTIQGGPNERHLVTYIPRVLPGQAAEWSGLVDVVSALYLSPFSDSDWKVNDSLGWSC